MKLDTDEKLYTTSHMSQPVHIIHIKVNDTLIENPFDVDWLYIDDYNIDLSIFPSVKESNPLSKLELFNTKPDTEDEVMKDE